MRECWRELLERKEEFIGGDVEDRDGNLCFRGPVTNIRIEQGDECEVVLVITEWLAMSWNGWQVHSREPYTFQINAEAEEMDVKPSRKHPGAQEVSFMGSSLILFGNKSPKLDPGKVRGLRENPVA